MLGSKEFINTTCYPLKVFLNVRSGDRVGRTHRVMEFCLEPNERKCVNYGNQCNPYLDGIRAVAVLDGGLTETTLLVTCKCSAIDNFLNTNREIRFLQSAYSLVIDARNCFC